MPLVLFAVTVTAFARYRGAGLPAGPWIRKVTIFELVVVLVTRTPRITTVVFTGLVGAVTIGVSAIVSETAAKFMIVSAIDLLQNITLLAPVGFSTKAIYDLIPRSYRQRS